MIDRLAQGDLEMEQCPMDRMCSVILTNNLQGRVFKEFRAELLNYTVEYMSTMEFYVRCGQYPRSV